MKCMTITTNLDSMETPALELPLPEDFLINVG